MDNLCPRWCVTGAEHLDEMQHMEGAFWHRSETVTVPTDDTSPRGVEITVEVRLEQLVLRDGETVPPVVFLGASAGTEGHSFRADQARELAGALLDVALLED